MHLNISLDAFIPVQTQGLQTLWTGIDLTQPHLMDPSIRLMVRDYVPIHIQVVGQQYFVHLLIVRDITLHFDKFHLT